VSASFSAYTHPEQTICEEPARQNRQHPVYVAIFALLARSPMASRTLTVANQITILRLVFVPIFAILVVQHSYVWALAILAAAAVSDAVDGIVARILHQESPLGLALDPLADKILMTTAYLTLAYCELLPWWLTIIVVSRDIGILVMALLISLVAGYRPFQPTWLGKASTVMQLATILLAVSQAAHVHVVRPLMVQMCVYLTAILTTASGIHYLFSLRTRPGLHQGGIE